MILFGFAKMEFQTQIEKVAIDAYNHDLCAYEPMLEPWGIELQVSLHLHPLSFLFFIVNNK
jgi:hypothetical protein